MTYTSARSTSRIKSRATRTFRDHPRLRENIFFFRVNEQKRSPKIPTADRNSDDLIDSTLKPSIRFRMPKLLSRSFSPAYDSPETLSTVHRRYCVAIFYRFSNQIALPRPDTDYNIYQSTLYDLVGFSYKQITIQCAAISKYVTHEGVCMCGREKRSFSLRSPRKAINY